MLLNSGFHQKFIPISFNEWKVLLNDSKAIVQSYGISLNESKRVFMFTKKKPVFPHKITAYEEVAEEDLEEILRLVYN